MMLKNLNFYLLVLFLGILISSCDKNDTEPPKQIQLDNSDERLCNITSSANRVYCPEFNYPIPVLENYSVTYLMNYCNVLFSRPFNTPVPELIFTKYCSAKASSENIIYYGQPIYDKVEKLTLIGGNDHPFAVYVANFGVLAHEAGHIIQFANNLPSKQEHTVRAQELEADGFSGYFLGSSKGLGVHWSWAAEAQQVLGYLSMPEEDANDPDHHGFPFQRRSAFRLGYLLGSYDLTIENFDIYFFWFYNSSVLTGKLRSNLTKPEDIDANLHGHILSKVEELRKINEGEMSDEEYMNLKDSNSSDISHKIFLDKIDELLKINEGEMF